MSPGHTHHGPEELLAIDFWYWRQRGWEAGVFGAGFLVETLPECGSIEVRGETFKPGGGEENLAPLEAVPVPIRFGMRDASVDPAGRDASLELIVEYCLER